MMSSWEFTNIYLFLAFLITSITLYHGGGHNVFTGTTSEIGHRQYALQRHGIWWCPCLENEPPTSNGIFWYPIPCTRYLVVIQMFVQEKKVTVLKCTHTMYSLQILLLKTMYTSGWCWLQLLTNCLNPHHNMACLIMIKY